MAAVGSRRISLLAGFAAALALAACSGAANSDLFEAAPGETDTSGTEPTPSSPEDPEDPAAPVNPARPDGGTPKPPPVPPPVDGGVPDAAPPPPPTCTVEVEPNNEFSKATLFTKSLCGKITSNTDVDFGRVVAPAGAQNIAITHAEKNGGVSYRYFINGVLVPMDGDELPLVTGATYTVQMRLSQGSSGDRPTYQVDVSFQ